MSFPEWGYSYNALCVPLTSNWQCSLVPARDVTEPTSWWSLSYGERQQKRKDREKQIEQDQRDFDRLFRVSTSRREARGCSNFSVYVAFIREYLRNSGVVAPVDGEGVTRIFRDAVRDGWLVPAIDRAWQGSRHVARSYGPQSWPKRAPDPKPTVYGVRDGQFMPPGVDGSFVDYTSYVPVAARAAATVGSAASSSGEGGFDWTGAVETVAGTLFGGDTDSGAGGGGDDNVVDEDFTSDASDDLTALGDTQPFNYQPDMPNGDSFDIVKTPNEGEPGTWFTNSGSGQMRLYGDDGRQSIDLDFDHDHGQGIPHAHNWSLDPLTGKNIRGVGVPFSLLP